MHKHLSRFFLLLFWAFLLMIGVLGEYLPRETLLLLVLFVFRITDRLVFGAAYLLPELID